MATVRPVDGEQLIWFDDSEIETVMRQDFGSPIYGGIMGIDAATALYVAGCRVTRPSSVCEEWLAASGKKFSISFDLTVSFDFMDRKEALALLRIISKAKPNPCSSAARMKRRNAERNA